MMLLAAQLPASKPLPEQLNCTRPAQILTFVLLFLLSFSGFLVSDVPVYFRCGQLATPSRATAVLCCAGGSALQQLLVITMPGRGAAH